MQRVQYSTVGENNIQGSANQKQKKCHKIDLQKTKSTKYKKQQKCTKSTKNSEKRKNNTHKKNVGESVFCLFFLHTKRKKQYVASITMVHRNIASFFPCMRKPKNVK